MRPSSGEGRIRVILADDDPSMRAALYDVIADERSLEVVAAAANGRDAVALAARWKPDVALVDVRMPHGGGVHAARHMRQVSPATAVVTLSAANDRESVVDMIEAGAVGYVVKGGPSAEVIDSIHLAANHECVLLTQATAHVVGELVRKLQIQKRMVHELQELDRIKSDFVSTVSHALRTPLTSIAGYVEMLLDGDACELNDGQHRMLDVVGNNTQRLLAQIEDLLTLGQIESGTFTIARAAIPLEPIIRAVGEAILPQAAARSLDLSLELATPLPDVVGDPTALDRALLNLAANAVKFTPSGGRVRITARHHGDTFQVTVAVDGIGIPEDEQQQLFTPFFRSSTATSEAIQGTGLGLLIVKSIIDNHHGTIAVRSAPEAGTIVTVTLPIAR